MATKPRPRKLFSRPATQTTTTPDSELVELAREFYAQNALMNKAKSVAEKARKALYKGMKEAGLDSIDCGIEIGGTVVPLEAKIGPGRATTVISVEKLLRVVLGDKVASTFLKNDKFASLMNVLSVTQKAVTDFFGGNVAAECSSTVPGTENVSVKKKG